MTSSFGSVGIHKQRCVGLCVFGKRKKRERKEKEKRKREKERRKNESSGQTQPTIITITTNIINNDTFRINQAISHIRQITTQTKKKRVLEEIIKKKKNSNSLVRLLCEREVGCGEVSRQRCVECVTHKKEERKSVSEAMKKNSGKRREEEVEEVSKK